MRFVPLALSLGIVALAAAAPTSNATHFCGPNGGSMLVLAIPPVFTSYYLVWDEWMGSEYLFSMWFYEESNGKTGLQRGGFCPGSVSYDICQDSFFPDNCFF